MWLLIAGGGMLVPLILALQLWTKRRRQLAAVAHKACPVCKTSFEDAITTHLGGIGPQVRSQLDHFQARYARFVLRCEDCGSRLVYTDDGAFIKRLPDR